MSSTPLSPLAEQAKALLDAVESEPTSTWPEALRIADTARQTGDLVAGAVSLRAAGIAGRLCAHFDEALQALDEAVAIAASIPDGRTILGETRASRAAVLLGLGRTDDALEDLEFATTSLDGVPRAFAQFQQASVWVRQGRADEANAALEECLGVFVAAGHTKYEAHARANRAILNAYRGVFDTADDDLLRAHDLWEALGLNYSAATAVHNQGFVAAGRGELLSALAIYRAAQRRYEDLGQPLAAVRLDQTEALLSLGLADEGLQLAHDAIAELEASGNLADLAEARLGAAFAGELAGQHEAAHVHASEALRLFRDQSRDGWIEVAELICLRLDTHLKATADGVVAALALRDRLEATGHKHHAQLAALSAAELALGLDNPELSAQALALIDANSPMPVETKLQHLSLVAECQQRTGDDPGLERTIDDGLALYRNHQRRFGAFEARANLGRHVQRLHHVAVASAYRAGKSERLLELVLGMRSASLQVRTASLRASAETTEQLGRLRALTLQAHRDPSIHDQVERERAELQQRIATDARVASTPGRDHDQENPWGAARARLGDGVLVTFADIDDRLIVLTCRATGRVDVSDRGSTGPVRDAIQALTLAANRLARSDTTGRSRGATEKFVTDIADDLDHQLAIGAVAGASTLFISAPSWMFSWPWGSLPSLRGQPFVLAPTYRVESPGPHGQGVALIAGLDLLTGTHEVEAIADIWTDPIMLTAEAATNAAVLDALGRARVAHLTAHYETNTQNPLFSHLLLRDGPLFAHEIAGLSCTPEVVVLGGCATGVNVAKPWDEAMGMSTGLLAAGVDTVICSPLLVEDTAATTDSLRSMHRGLASGQSAATALATSRADGSRDGSHGFISLVLL